MTVRSFAAACGLSLALAVWAEEQETPEVDTAVGPASQEVTEPTTEAVPPEPESQPVSAPTERVVEPAAEVDVTRILTHLDELEGALQSLRQEVEALRGNTEVAASDELSAESAKDTAELSLPPEEPMTLGEEMLEGVLQETESGAIPSQQVYDPATWMFKRGKTAFRDFDFYNAARIFERFLEQYPNHAQANNARYWLGEIAYEQGDFSTAVDYLQQVVAAGDSPHHLVAYLKIGYARFELGEYEQAKLILREVQEQAPGSNLARLAQLRLERLERHTGDE